MGQYLHYDEWGKGAMTSPTFSYIDKKAALRPHSNQVDTHTPKLTNYFLSEHLGVLTFMSLILYYSASPFINTPQVNTCSV